jgi:LCP family protein required for cell wall assembly
MSVLVLLLLLGGCTGDSSPATLSANQRAGSSKDDSSSLPTGSFVTEAEAQSDRDGAGAENADAGIDVDIDHHRENLEQTAVDSPETRDATSSVPPVAEPEREHSLTNGSRPLDQTTNILVLGSDRRPDTPNWRTDVLMIVALDRENGRAGVISIPRDVFIEEIPNHQPNRINVIDYLGELDEPDGGGPALLSDIIEQNMGIPIHHYLRFSFDSFREVVDALGGVPVDIDCVFQGYIEDEGGWLVLEPGLHRLTGNQAMIYVRDRQLTGGDLNRARRQQRFVWAVRNQVLDENLLTRIPALYTALSDSVDTDIGLVTALQFARLALALDPEDLHGMVVAPPDMLEEGWALGMSVFLPDWALIGETVQLVLDNPPFVFGNTPEDCPQ